MVFALVTGLAFWYQMSPYSFNQYVTICTSNYGNAVDYNQCMNPYWSQYNINRIGLFISLGAAFVFAIISIINKLSRKI